MAAVPAPPRPPEPLADGVSSSHAPPPPPPYGAVVDDMPSAPSPPSPAYSTPPPPTWPTTLTYFLALLGLLALLARALKIAARNRRRRKDALRSRKRKEKRRQRRAVAAAVNAAGQSAGDDADVVDGGDGVPRDVRDLRVVESEESDSEDDEDDDEDESDLGVSIFSTSCPIADYAAVLGSALTSILVHAAILLKRSPIPDLLFSLTNTTVDGYARVNRALGVEAKIVRATQKALAAGVTATGVVAHAAIRAGLAYQMAPGRREKKILRMTGVRAGTDTGVAAASGNLLAGLSFPGGIPRGAKTDAATQTGGSDEAAVLAAPTSPPPPPPPATSVRGVLSTYLSSTLRVAGNAATAGSEAMLGKTRTQKLLGVEKRSADGAKPTTGDVYPNDDDDDDDDGADAAGPVLYLNVGGSVHATTLRTLTRVEGSLLAEWFGDASKRITLELKDGSFFVDRDGTNFHHILAHLRNPTSITAANPTSTNANLLPTAADEISQLIVEAIFYRLPDLVDDLSRRLARVERDAVSVSDLLAQIAARSFDVVVGGGGVGGGGTTTPVIATAGVLVAVLGVGVWWQLYI
ncbi:hypothetical protein HDU87_003069 [Geranomyces variabilis]|uniref:Potassium channel tetramerisation-type BTB domain-containing protein n=1 Tax=Geranomyces variabilis TaxID=109894 RepID=A0AAD5TKJ1_9FUNG|nr:hypothetical protein HDU87_003069 [Geranomyces variabilis]